MRNARPFLILKIRVGTAGMNFHRPIISGPRERGSWIRKRYWSCLNKIELRTL
jgi:hypothetical protein